MTATAGDRTFGTLRTKFVSVSLDGPLGPITGLDGYEMALVLVRLGGETLGVVRVPVEVDRCPAAAVASAIAEGLDEQLLRARLLGALESAPAERRLDLAAVVDATPAYGAPPEDTVTVAVCTRDRPEQLTRCVEALARQRLPARIVVVDNAPATAATRDLVGERFPHVDYIVEERPGLSHARNRAIAIAESDVLAFIDDDAVADEYWTWMIARAFHEEPTLGIVTGLVAPLELETPAQHIFERLGGFGRGFRRRWVAPDPASGAGRYLGAGQFGTGANMALRRSVLATVGGFDVALGAGSAVPGGEDLDMFHRVLLHGHSLRYDPSVVVFHEHRRTLAELERQLYENGSVWAMLATARAAGRATTPELARVMRWYAARYWPRRLVRSLIVPNRIPPALPLAEIRGTLAAVARGAPPSSPGPPAPDRAPAAPRQGAVPIATIDVRGDLGAAADERGTEPVRRMIVVTRDGAAIGRLHVGPDGPARCERSLRELIVDECGVALLDESATRARRQLQENALLAARAGVWAASAGSGSAPVRSVSVVIATLDRPADLAACLASVFAQEYRPLEVVVVDNNPASGSTSSVLDRFPEVVRVEEPRQGLAYARNAGIRRATGEVVVTTDDDVRVPAGWLNRLVEPFRRNDVMAVCGNVLPLELETAAQIEIERTGGLSKGFERFESSWENERSIWRAFPAWQLGATANAAFRASAFRHREIGMMDPALGAGMPTGVGEDSYLLYRIVRAGYTVVYEPAAYVWHRHRDTPEALVEQVTNYYSGHVAHQLTTLLHDGDPRAINRLVRFAGYVVGCRAAAVVRRGPVSSVIAKAQLRGALSGPANYVRARRRVASERRVISR